MSTTNHMPARPRLRGPAIAAGGVTVGLAVAVALMRHETDRLPISLICATAAAFAIALVLSIVMGPRQTPGAGAQKTDYSDPIAYPRPGLTAPPLAREAAWPAARAIEAGHR